MSQDEAREAAAELEAILADGGRPAAAITQLFDGLSHDGRVGVVRGLARRTQRASMSGWPGTPSSASSISCRRIALPWAKCDISG